MPFQPTDFPGLWVFEPRVFEDPRGYFFESYNQRTFDAAGIDCKFVQDNQSRSSRGVLRGLHYQHEPMAQCKLVRVIAGEVLDVAVDIRKGSPLYGKSFRIRLSAENRKQVFIPCGFAHGFVVLSDHADVIYKCDNYYSKEHESGILFSDPDLNVDWGVDLSHVLVSDRDRALPPFAKAVNRFVYDEKEFQESSGR